jgi:hypothetical protein
MDELRKHVRRAQRLLAAQQFVRAIGWCWFAALTLAVTLIAVDRFSPLGVAPWLWGAGALGLGLAAALLWTFVTRHQPLLAALEIDRRFGLKERISSALAMPHQDRETAAGEALVADAVHRAARINLAEKFALRLPRHVLLPLVPGALALLVAMWGPPAALEKPAAANSDPVEVQQQVKISSEALGRRLAEHRRQAEKLGLKEAEQLLRQVEQASKNLAASPPERTQALVELNDLVRQLHERRQSLDAVEQIRRQLEQIKSEPAQSQLSDEQQRQLAGQLERMREKVRRLAAARQAAQADLQERAEQLRQAGQVIEAGQIEEQLDKFNLVEQAPLQAGLQDLQQQLAEVQVLDDALDQLARARQQMTCPRCGGAGCAACQNLPGVGFGPGQGETQRPGARTETASYESRVRQRVGKGAALVVGAVEGPNVQGNVQQQIQQQFDAVRQGSTDPLSGQRIPRKHRQHAQEYFDRLREGK